jgi:predicted secreted hydrolase
MKISRILIPLLILLAIAGSIYFWWQSTKPTLVAGQLISEQDPISGFAKAEGAIPLSFPETFGPHLDYQTEWWYYTGNLDTADGRHFGYQLTFFRRGVLPEEESGIRVSDWATNQIYFAHFTLTDVEDERFYHYERFSRGAVGLAGAQAMPYQVWLEDWEIKEIKPGTYELSAQQEEIRLSLTLEDMKGPVLQGEGGFSQKGAEPGNASYYYSQTRLYSSGTILVGEQSYIVEGLSWKDHEFSTSSLSPEQVGWDWFSIQLDNNIEIMLGQIRREDGTIDSYAAGLIVYPDGGTTHLTIEDFTITALDSWESPQSGATYPAEWRVEIPGEILTLRLTPYLDDQELLTSVIYWEGAVSIVGEINGEQITGYGYVELTGYAQSMEGGF